MRIPTAFITCRAQVEILKNKLVYYIDCTQ